jgi:hypothetical protein
LTQRGLSDRLSLRLRICREAVRVTSLSRISAIFRWAFRWKRGAVRRGVAMHPVLRRPCGMAGPSYALEFRVSPSVGIHQTDHF